LSEFDGGGRMEAMRRNNSPLADRKDVSRRLSAHVDERVVLLALDQLANANLLVETGGAG